MAHGGDYGLGSSRSGTDQERLMAYKDLLVVVDSEPQARDRMVLAADIAQRFEAHLVGLYVTEGLETQRRYNRPCSDLIDEARAQFDNIAGGRPFTTEW